MTGPAAAAEQARADLRRTLEAGGPIDDEIVHRLILPLVDKAAPVMAAFAAATGLYHHAVTGAGLQTSLAQVATYYQAAYLLDH